MVGLVKFTLFVDMLWWSILSCASVPSKLSMVSMRNSFACPCTFSSLMALFRLSDAGAEELAIGVFWVTDGIDRCLVGFLPRHLIPYRSKYEGRAAQIVEFLKHSEEPAERKRSHKMRGVCLAALLQNPY